MKRIAVPVTLAAAAFALALAGCTPTSPNAPTSSPAPTSSDASSSSSGTAVPTATPTLITVSDAAQLDGTWSVASTPGDAPQDVGALVLTFAGGAVTGDLGCNTLSGDYELSDGAMLLSIDTTTEIACSGDAAVAESYVLARATALPMTFVEDTAHLVDETGQLHLVKLAR